MVVCLGVAVVWFLIWTMAGTGSIISALTTSLGGYADGGGVIEDETPRVAVPNGQFEGSTSDEYAGHASYIVEEMLFALEQQEYAIAETYMSPRFIENYSHVFDGYWHDGLYTSSISYDGESEVYMVEVVDGYGNRESQYLRVVPRKGTLVVQKISDTSEIVP